MRHTPKIVHCHISGDFERWQRSVRTKRRLSAFFSLKSTKIIANLDGQQSAYFTLYAAISTGDSSNGYSLYRANTHPVRRSLATCTLSLLCYVEVTAPCAIVILLRQILLVIALLLWFYAATISTKSGVCHKVMQSPLRIIAHTEHQYFQVSEAVDWEK